MGPTDYSQMIQQLQAQRGGAPMQGPPQQMQQQARPMMGANGMPVGAPQRRPQAIRGPVPGQPQTAESVQQDPAIIQQQLLEQQAQQQGMR